MSGFLQFLILGLGIGAVYSLAAQGLILIYKGSGVLNFAHGAIGLLGAYVCWDLTEQSDVPFFLALPAGVLVSALVGVLVQVLVMRPLGNASALTRVIATLGVLLVVQAGIVLMYGSAVTVVDSQLPQDTFELGGGIVVGLDRVILLVVAAVLTAVLWAVFKYTRFGLGTVAVAENRRSAAALGWSASRIATATWGVGSGLAGLAAILISPIIQLQVNSTTSLMLAAMAVALLANFTSFPTALVAGLVVGAIQSEFVRYTTTPGLPQAVPFIVIAVVLVVRGKSIPLRDHLNERLPSVGTGRIRPVPVILAFLALVALAVALPGNWASSLSVTFGVATVILSIVVLTGYAGQISLAQYAIAGIGAFIAGRLAAVYDLPFALCLLIGVVATVPIGVLFAVPALRTRGINLAIVTLGLGSAVELVIFNNPDFVGGYSGTQVRAPSLFGFSIDGIVHPDRYAIFTVFCFFAAALVVSNVRRGASGRRLLAVRTNERAAAALGISVRDAKTYAFGLSSAIAALGGVLIAFQSSTIVYNTFTSTTSILVLGLAVIGGVGYLAGPVLGATLASGAIGTLIANTIFSGIATYIQLISGIVLLVFVLTNPDGAARSQLDLVRAVVAKVTGGKAASAALSEAGRGNDQRRKVTPQHLVVSDVTVRYGNTIAVDGLSLTVDPGQVVGLIGPNGAGKTSALDAITGFVGSSTGSVRLNDLELHGSTAAARSRAGVGRSFQSLELFEDMTVYDNLLVASDDHSNIAYVRDLVAPRKLLLSPAAQTVVRDFGLTEHLHSPVRDLSYGQRRQLAIARAVASGPSVLLLDEPAAGLSDDASVQLGRTIRELADVWGIAVLLVEHDMNLVISACDQLVVLDFGGVIARGTPESVTANPAVIEAYLGLADEEEQSGDASRNGEESATAENTDRSTASARHSSTPAVGIRK